MLDLDGDGTFGDEVSRCRPGDRPRRPARCAPPAALDIEHLRPRRRHGRLRVRAAARRRPHRGRQPDRRHADDVRPRDPGRRRRRANGVELGLFIGVPGGVDFRSRRGSLRLAHRSSPRDHRRHARLDRDHRDDLRRRAPRASATTSRPQIVSLGVEINRGRRAGDRGGAGLDDRDSARRGDDVPGPTGGAPIDLTIAYTEDDLRRLRPLRRRHLRLRHRRRRLPFETTKVDVDLGHRRRLDRRAR